MNLYLIKANKPTGYDSYDGHVLVAETPEDAVKLAQQFPGDEGHSAWDTQHVTLLAADVPLKAGIILSSFNAG